MVVIKVIFALLPVLAFLIILLILDSYKLVKLSSIISTLIVGCMTALLSFILNQTLLTHFEIDIIIFRQYIAPVLEEFLKGVFLFFLIKTRRIGFMVDAAIFGFSIGAGFAFIENIYYLYTLDSANLLLWIIRGFGTAIMHGGTTAMLGILSKSIVDRRKRDRIGYYLPGLALAIVIHSLFNHFLLHPLLASIGILIILPIIMVMVFERSEKALQKWLDVGFDSDVQLLQMIRSGEVLKSRMGEYLVSLKKSVPGEILADMLCYLQLSVELALKAKGILLMHEAGFKSPAEHEIKNKLIELKELEKNIGKTGRQILSPFLHARSQDLWQLHMLEGSIVSGPGLKLLKKNRK
jgi:RsiW-degrading membrane proteinase PrsW (M82 family)